MRAVRADLPAGALLCPLAPHPDERGVFTELFREQWGLDVAPVQWNAVRSEAGVLRGVHVHVRHDDYLTVVVGRATIGLVDLRRSSETPGARGLVEMSDSSPCGLVIPHGVAHGFLFHEPSVHVYAVSHYWDPADELGCRWDDPQLGLEWPRAPESVSPRDRALPSMAALVGQLGAGDPTL